ncbi:NADH dehydrogenase (ubiquinone) 78K chain precursor, 5-prime end [Blyttiomyces sp. JEL0837]|nr:NADH dehydrogenase (ubiquinone) 78K chain precursor, 5-prime end [Blyttiomyces sp. JEL0837]
MIWSAAKRLLTPSVAATRCLKTNSTTARIQRGFSSTSRAQAEVEVFIDGRSVKIEQGAAIIQACESAGVDIPRFCYHERLAIAGNCRMCLVELEKSPKPVASCAMPVMPGMKIKTNTPLVKKAREGVMEFLLANHPLDCPICDQGGECDLQDQSVRFGSDRSRFHEPVGKRAVEDKNFGPLIKTVMTRCIQCTRCVRFANEVAGAVELGTSGRGNDMQIGTYIEKTLNSEMSGNVIDLCPVGALTAKPHAFNARPWELKRTESIDVLDAVGSNIRIDSRGLEVMRVVPRLNDEINEEWISDKTRFACDGLKTQRLTTPLIRQGDTFVTATWPEALETISSKLSGLKGGNIMGVAGQLSDAESLVVLKDFLNRLGSENLTLDSVPIGKLPASTTDIRSNYVLNASILGVEQADVILLIGTNPRHEAAILNTRIRKTYLNNGTDIGVIGQPPALNYEYEHVGTDPSAIAKLVNGQDPFAKKLQTAKRPLIIVGSHVLERADGGAVLASVAGLAESLKATAQPGWQIYNFLQRAASWTAALDIGFQSSLKSPDATKFIYLLNADNVPGAEIPKDAFVVYQGHHGDQGAYYADVILPGAAYTEKSATFVNTEGRTQVTRAAVAPPAGAREDWKIIRALAEVSGVDLRYETIGEVRERMAEIAPNLVSYDAKEGSAFVDVGLKGLRQSALGTASAVPFDLPIKDFYMTDPISRASSTMAKCSQEYTFGVKGAADPKIAC